ncbi:hypothetical protein [Vreelandella sp. EE22]
MTVSYCDWIDQNNAIQVNWIIDYLGKRHAGFYQYFRNNSVFKNPHSLLLLRAIEANMNDPLFRECYEKSKNAWRQKKVRQQPNKKSATFVLPVSTLDTLEKLSKKHKNTKVKELCTVISDAWHDHQRAIVNVQKTKATYQKQLKSQQVKYQQTEQAYQRVIETLLTSVAEQIDQRCALEAKMGGPDNSPIEAADMTTYEALMESQIAALEPHLINLVLVRSQGELLAERLAVLARERKLTSDTSATIGEP